MTVHKAVLFLQTRGYLNYDVWHWIVGYLVDDMRITKEFPLDPDVSTVQLKNRVQGYCNAVCLLKIRSSFTSWWMTVFYLHPIIAYYLELNTGSTTLS